MQYKSIFWRYVFTFLCLLVVLLPAGCGGGGGGPAVLPAPEGQISGTVSDSDSGLPLAGVTVTINGQNQVSDDLGRYGFSSIAVGTWPMTALLSGYGNYSSWVSVSGGVSVVVNLTMKAEPQNIPPIADAGVDRTVPVNTNVILDKGGSADADGDTLIYSWTLLDIPDGSAAEIVSSSFVADLPGIYVVELSVNDGQLSDTDLMEIEAVVDSVTNSIPVAYAGVDLGAIPGATVVLDGSGSSDPDGNLLTYYWSFVGLLPSGSKAVLTGVNDENPSFVADLPGEYHLRLMVSDDTVDSATDYVTVSVAVDNINILGMSFNRIPAGSFLMGSPLSEIGRDNDEKQFRVELTQDYYLMTTEVTQGQWQAVMGSNPSVFNPCRGSGDNGDNCPVENVSWDEVQDFILNLNALTIGQDFRLPSEAEWEYAARAGTVTATYGGDLAADGVVLGEDPVLNGLAWYYNNSGSKSNLVGRKAPNPWGLYDMMGNVWEWTGDWYGDYPAGPAIDPIGPGSGLHRVKRGGGWNSAQVLVRSASRSTDNPGKSYGDLGFRLVLPVD